MRSGEWTLTYGEERIAFGHTDADAVLIAAPDLGDADIEAGDAPRPRADGINFGVDFRGGRTVTLEAAVLRSTEAETLEALERITRVWRADEVRRTPGAVAMLTSAQGGRERVAFGRPRRFKPDVDLVADGMATFVADFAALDDAFYSATESSATVALVPSLEGGLEAPLASPLTTTESSDRSIGITVGGSLPAWPVITIEGPITNPTLDVLGAFSLTFRTTLATGQSLVIDTRPWARTIHRDGAPVPGVLSRTSSRLRDASLPPGTHEVALRGLSESGSASARITWRDSFSTI